MDLQLTDKLALVSSGTNGTALRVDGGVVKTCFKIKWITDLNVLRLRGGCLSLAPIGGEGWGEGAKISLACIRSLFGETLGVVTNGAPGGAIGPRVLPASKFNI